MHNRSQNIRLTECVVDVRGVRAKTADSEFQDSNPDSGRPTFSAGGMAFRLTLRLWAQGQTWGLGRCPRCWLMNCSCVWQHIHDTFTTYIRVNSWLQHIESFWSFPFFFFFLSFSWVSFLLFLLSLSLLVCQR
jgi:hypothetical protein